MELKVLDPDTNQIHCPISNSNFHLSATNHYRLNIFIFRHKIVVTGSGFEPNAENAYGSARETRYCVEHANLCAIRRFKTFIEIVPGNLRTTEADFSSTGPDVRRVRPHYDYTKPSRIKGGNGQGNK